jgi:hypothetical protein
MRKADYRARKEEGRSQLSSALVPAPRFVRLASCSQARKLCGHFSRIIKCAIQMENTVGSEFLTTDHADRENVLLVIYDLKPRSQNRAGWFDNAVEMGMAGL